MPTLNMKQRSKNKNGLINQNTNWKSQTAGITHVSIEKVTIKHFVWWSCCHCPICNPGEDIRETGGAVLSAARCLAVSISRVVREETTWPARAGLGPLELLHRRPRAVTPRWSKIVIEGDPLTLRPWHAGEGVDALWRAGGGGALDGVNWLSWQGDGSTLGSRWYRFECLRRVFWWVPGRGSGRRERGDIFGLLALCQGRRALPV